jgi:hypothetical protein
MRLPLVALLPGDDSALASRILSAGLGAATVLLLLGALRSWGVGRTRVILGLALLAHPWFLAACCDGSSTTTALWLALACGGALVEWMTRRALRDLVGFGFAAALLFATTFEGAAWVLVLVLLFTGLELTRRGPWRQKESTLLLGLMPLAYTAGLWVLMNWLIMGDALYFVRPLLAGISGLEPPAQLPPRHQFFQAAVLALALVALGHAAWRRDRGGIVLGLMALAVAGTAAVLASRRLLWEPDRMLFGAFPLALAALGYTAGRLRAWPTHWAAGVAVLPMALSLAVAVAPPAAGVTGRVDALTQAESQWLARLEQHAARRSAFTKVFVCGYDSFALLRQYRGDVLLHALDFSFEKARDDYRGHVLYVLVPRPEARAAMDSVHWKFHHIFVQGSRTTLYDSDWGPWRLFEIVQAPGFPGP